MDMIWHDDVRPYFPVGGFSPDGPQEKMVFFRRQPRLATLGADGDKCHCGLMLFDRDSSIGSKSRGKWICFVTYI